MKFSGKYDPRSSSSTGHMLGDTPGEAEVQRWNPQHCARIREAGGWTTLTAGSLNLYVDRGDFDKLLGQPPSMIERGTDIRYPTDYEHIPISRVEYYYYRATATRANKSCQVLARRAKCPGPIVVELFADVKLVTALDLNPGDDVNVEIPP